MRTLIPLLFPAAVLAADFSATHGLPAKDYQAWVDKASKDMERLAWVNGFGNLRFNAIALKDEHAWEARHNLDAAQYQKEFTTITGKGFRPICTSGYTRGGVVNFAAVFVKDNLAVPFDARHGQTSAEYAAHFLAMAKKGFHPICVNGYADGDSIRFASIFIDYGQRDFFGWHDQTSEQYQKHFDELVPQGYRCTAISAYRTKQGPRFAVVFTRDGGPDFAARHALTSAEYQKEFKTLTKKGFIPKQVVGYEDRGDRYACLFEMPPKKITYPLPMQGVEVAKFKPFDDAMQTFLKERGFTGATLAVMKDGKLLLSRGYGYRDGEKDPMKSDTPMRIASISKPITLAALKKLLASGKLKADTKVVEYLGLKVTDPRWNDITIQHLIEHKAGFDRTKSGDPMFESVKISKALGKPGPATAADTITWMAGRPLDFPPGSERQYSNFGYALLGRVIEKATGERYIDYMKKTHFQPLGLASFDLGRSLPANRKKAEPVYIHNGLGTNVMIPNSGSVKWPDGGFHLEAMDAHGGLICSAPDLAKWFSHYWMNGEPRNGDGQEWLFFGSLPGTYSAILQRPDGYIIAALFNQRSEGNVKDDAIADLLKKAAAVVK